MGCEGGEARGKGCESTRGSVERFGVLSGGGESERVLTREDTGGRCNISFLKNEKKKHKNERRG
jgi:hypothetical protein